MQRKPYKRVTQVFIDRAKATRHKVLHRLEQRAYIEFMSLSNFEELPESHITQNWIKRLLILVNKR